MTIHLIGNIGKDAQVRKVKVGEREDSVVDIWVAENIKKRSGAEKTLWHKVTIWRGYADTMAPYLKAGRKVYVVGTAEAGSYTNKENKIVPYIQVQASELKLLDSKREESVPPETEPAEETIGSDDTPW